jgi:hypothetical protein
MAISLAFGVAFATLITLFLVPSLYMILEDAKALLRGEGGEGGPAEVAEMRLRPSGDPDEIRNAG